MAEQKATTDQIFVNAGFGYNTRLPFVSLRLKDVATMMRVEEARDLAMNLLQAAEAAESDQFIIEWVTKEMKGSDQAAVVLLKSFRELRQSKRKEG